MLPLIGWGLAISTICDITKKTHGHHILEQPLLVDEQSVRQSTGNSVARKLVMLNSTFIQPCIMKCRCIDIFLALLYAFLCTTTVFTFLNYADSCDTQPSRSCTTLIARAVQKHSVAVSDGGWISCYRRSDVCVRACVSDANWNGNTSPNADPGTRGPVSHSRATVAGLGDKLCTWCTRCAFCLCGHTITTCAHARTLPQRCRVGD